MEDQLYVVACNTGGKHAGVPMGGHSMVVDPWGDVLAEAGEGEEVLVVELDPELVRGPGRRSRCSPTAGCDRLGLRR